MAQARQPAFLQSVSPPLPATAPPSSEDMELAMAINASIQSAMQNEMPSSLLPVEPSPSKEGQSPPLTHQTPSQPVGPEIISSSSAPSAPPMDTEIMEDGPIHYPMIDMGPVDLNSPSPAVQNLPASTSGSKGEDGSDKKESSSCVICLDAPVEGACIPCGHMAGCMSCMNEIKAKKWGCPVCRAKIDQVIRLYAV